MQHPQHTQLEELSDLFMRQSTDDVCVAAAHRTDTPALQVPDRLRVHLRRGNGPRNDGTNGGKHSAWAAMMKGREHGSSPWPRPKSSSLQASKGSQQEAGRQAGRQAGRLAGWQAGCHSRPQKKDFPDLTTAMLQNEGADQFHCAKLVVTPSLRTDGRPEGEAGTCRLSRR